MSSGDTTLKNPSLSNRTISTVRDLVAFYQGLPLSAKVSLIALVTIVVVTVFAPLIAPYQPTAVDYDASLAAPSFDHPLGTDLTGRDLLSRIIFGGRVSFGVGIGSVALGILVGVPIGSVSAYLGGWVDEVLMRFMDVAISFPALVLALALVGTLGANLWNLILVIGIVYSPQYARLMHGQVLAVKEVEFVEAAKNTGLSDTKILLRHILPNAFTPVLVQATFHIALAIILEASLSFLGLGIQPPTPSWGIMIADGRSYLPDQWWISTFPGVMILVTALSFNLLGDGLRDEFDPRSATE